MQISCTEKKNRSLGCRKICHYKLKAQLLSCRRVAKWWQNGDKIVTKWWLTFPTGERGTQFLRTVESNALVLSWSWCPFSFELKSHVPGFRSSESSWSDVLFWCHSCIFVMDNIGRDGSTLVWNHRLTYKWFLVDEDERSQFSFWTPGKNSFRVIASVVRWH